MHDCYLKQRPLFGCVCFGQTTKLLPLTLKSSPHIFHLGEGGIAFHFQIVLFTLELLLTASLCTAELVPWCREKKRPEWFPEECSEKGRLPVTCVTPGSGCLSEHSGRDSAAGHGVGLESEAVPGIWECIPRTTA